MEGIDMGEALLHISVDKVGGAYLLKNTAKSSQNTQSKCSCDK
jgi:hypothetical protein